MTPAEIEALRALCDAATPGPWWVDTDTEGESRDVVAHGPYDDTQSGIAELSTPEDAAFIAAARTAVPALLSALEEARAEVRVNAALWDAWKGRAEEAESRADALQAESDALHQKFDAEHKRANALQAEAMANHAKYHGALSTIPVVVAKETERLRARADAAWRAGAEAMREAAAKVVEGNDWRGGLAASIRRLALPPPSATPDEEK